MLLLHHIFEFRLWMRELDQAPYRNSSTHFEFFNFFGGNHPKRSRRIMMCKIYTWHGRVAIWNLCLVCRFWACQKPMLISSSPRLFAVGVVAALQSQRALVETRHHAVSFST